VRKRLDDDQVFKIIEINLGKWKPQGIAILDVNFRVWGVKGEIPNNVINFYEKFSLSHMHIGDMVSNNNTFMIKATEKTGIIVAMKDNHLAMLSAINLKGRINALTALYEPEKSVEAEAEEKIRDAEACLRVAEMFLKEGVNEAASDLTTLSGFHYLLANMIENARMQSNRALELCREKGITNYHQTFALSCSEACNNNLKEAVEHWEQVQDKYTPQEKDLVNEALKEAKERDSFRRRLT